MMLTVDVSRTTPHTAGPTEPSHLWILGLTARDDEVGKPEAAPYSFLAECECPHDCPRDHENE